MPREDVLQSPTGNMLEGQTCTDFVALSRDLRRGRFCPGVASYLFMCAYRLVVANRPTPRRKMLAVTQVTAGW